MARIEIPELRPAGSELFQDSESFLNELSDREISAIQGGIDILGISLSVITAIGVKSNSFNANTIGQRNVVA